MDSVVIILIVTLYFSVSPRTVRTLSEISIDGGKDVQGIRKRAQCTGRKMGEYRCRIIPHAEIVVR